MNLIKITTVAAMLSSVSALSFAVPAFAQTAVGTNIRVEQDGTQDSVVPRRADGAQRGDDNGSDHQGGASDDNGNDDNGNDDNGNGGDHDGQDGGESGGSDGGHDGGDHDD